MTVPAWIRVLESGLSRLGRLPGTQSNVLASAPATSKRLLYAAAFFTFASLGFIVDVMRPEIHPPLMVLLSAAAIAPDPGDLVAIVTDGLTEVFDARDDEFGLERLAQTIRAGASEPLKAIADTVLRVTRAHGPQSDDQTLLLVRVR